MGDSRLIVGLMSGTSVDGIDAALVRVSRGVGEKRGKYGAKVLFHHEHPWPEGLRERLLAAMAPAQVRVREICELNVLVAREFAMAVGALLMAAGVKRGKIAAIGSHGQTVCHLPETKKDARGITNGAMGSTLQIGDVSVIGALTGMVTVGNFRPADMAVGGQGAPLVPWADEVLLRHETKVRCVQNIGGIANVTYLPPQTANRRTRNAKSKGEEAGADVIAFDTGPGNMVMDAVAALGTRGRLRYDVDGALAGRGELDRALFRQLQGHGYFARRPPKSTGRELFGMAFARKLLTGAGKGMKLETLVHTLTRWTAWSIADAYVQFLPEMPDEVILCGGGADNPVLVRMLGEELAGLRSEFTQPVAPVVRQIDEFGIPNKAKEAASFALLAAATLDGVCGNLPSVTGADRGAVLGVVARPRRKDL